MPKKIVSYAACLLKPFFPLQRAHTTLFIRCDKPECLCILHPVIQMSPDEVVGSSDGCCDSIANGTVDVPIRLFRQISSTRTALFSWPFA